MFGRSGFRVRGFRGIGVSRFGVSDVRGFADSWFPVRGFRGLGFRGFRVLRFAVFEVRGFPYGVLAVRGFGFEVSGLRG